jgi:cation transport ATPase
MDTLRDIEPAVPGNSAVDEAMLNGESVPADKKSGGELFAGTVNLSSRLVMRVAATGESTALGFISPIFCATAMGVSDLIVIGNALRLLRWRQ